MSDYDGAWKEALDHYFPQFLAFFFPLIYADIDWSEGYESLEQELRQIAPQTEGKRFVDALFKVRLKGTKEEVYIHIEVQNRNQEDFTWRTNQYNGRASDRYGDHVVTVVVYGDDDPTWRPEEYLAVRWGCERKLRFPTAKLLKYAKDLEALERDPNPFALLTLAHLQALATRKDMEARRDWKKRLILGLYDRGLDEEEMRQAYKLLDWVLDLPKELDEQVWAEVARFEKERSVTHITFAERYGREKGREEEREEILPGYRQSIEMLLQARYGALEEALVQKLRNQTDPAVLRQVVDALAAGVSLEDVRALLG